MLTIVPPGGSPATWLVTFTQFAAASLVYQIWPSLVPAQMSPFWTFEGAIANTTSP
jgi:hypothetical protein